MPETTEVIPAESVVDDVVPPQQEKPTGKFVSAAKPVPMHVSSAPNQQGQATTTETTSEPTTNNEGANAISEATNGVGVNAPAPTFTDEQLTTYFQSQGIKFEGIEKLKEKINHVAPQEPTEEEKTKAALAKEKKMVDVFVSGGGTVEQYVAIKAVAEADLAELSMNNTKAELKAAGFTSEQADEIIRERYYQITDEELEQYDDESDKEYFKRKKEYGANKLANRSSYTKKQAQDILAELTAATESEDMMARDELSLSSKIDEQFKTLPRKLTLEIGTVDGKPVPPIEYEVSESDISEVQAMLKDPDRRKQFFYNQDGGLNLANLATVLTRNKMLESTIKAAYHEGGSRTVAEFEKTFPARTAQEIGVGGSNRKETGKGKLVSWSKPLVVNRPPQQR